MTKHGWEHYELEKEIGNSNMAQLLELFKRENKKYIAECVKYVDLRSDLSEEGLNKSRELCEHLNEARMKISLVIAERLTDTSRIQHEVRPKN